MLGQDVVRAAGAVGYTRAELDVTDRDAVADAIGPDDVVINCAAWTDVDGAEEHEDEALRSTATARATSPRPPAPSSTCRATTSSTAPRAEPYLESDPVNPLSGYGRTKLAGERATAAANPRHFIVRSSWLFGAGGKNFVETMLGLGPEVRVVDDQVGCPTFTGHLAEALAELAAQRGLRRPPRRRERLLLVVRVRPRDLRAGRLRHARRALHHRRVPAPGAAARVLRARQRARRPAAHLAAGPRRLPRSAG